MVLHSCQPLSPLQLVDAGAAASYRSCLRVPGHVATGLRPPAHEKSDVNACDDRAIAGPIHENFLIGGLRSRSERGEESALQRCCLRWPW